MIELALVGFVLGLSGIPHCAAMCGPLAVVCGRDRLVQWQLGRASSYMLLGALAGAFGDVLPGPTWLPFVVSILLLTYFAISIGGLAPEPGSLSFIRAAGAATASRKGGLGGYLFGVANGLIPCAMVYAALGLALGTASATLGVLVMSMFATGTIVSFQLLGRLARHLPVGKPGARKVVAAVALACGVFVISFRQFGGDHHQHHGVTSVDQQEAGGSSSRSGVQGHEN